MDEATKLLRRWLEVQPGGVLADETRAHLAALPAAAPRETTLVCSNCGAQTHLHPHQYERQCFNCRTPYDVPAAAQPAPLPGPPREPPNQWIRKRALEVASWHESGLLFEKAANALADAWRKGEGDCVIAPNPAGVQGQSTMQESGVTCDQTERLADLDAKSLSHAGDHAAEPAIGPTYYVRHPDDSYSVADPQPILP